MSKEWNLEERRHFVRIEKHFIISYYDKGDPALRHDVSQLKNISLGGMCFITGQKYKISTKMGIELKTPYFSGTAHMEGTILESYEKVEGMIYETRLQFHNLNTYAELVLKKIVDTFTKIRNINNKEK